MIIAFGCDHAGFDYKSRIIEYLNSRGDKVLDCGCFSKESCDYPDYALPVAEYVSNKKCDKGILVCGTGVGMSIAANKVYGIRAAVCYNDDIAKLVREHNDANVLCLSARFAPVEDTLKWIKTWLDTPFSGEQRHLKRINKITEIDRKCRRK